MCNYTSGVFISVSFLFPTYSRRFPFRYREGRGDDVSGCIEKREEFKRKIVRDAAKIIGGLLNRRKRSRTGKVLSSSLPDGASHSLRFNITRHIEERRAAIISRYVSLSHANERTPATQR